MPDGLTPYTTMRDDVLVSMPLQAAPTRQQTGWGAMYIHAEGRIQQLRTWRWSWWTYWGALAEFFSPRRWKFWPTANKTTRGNPINDQIIDSTGLQALNTCAGGMWSGLTNPNMPWFKMGIALKWVKPDAAATQWLESTENKMNAILAPGQSNFYDIMRQVFSDVALFGTSPVLIYEDYEDVVRFYLPCAGEYFLGVGSRLTHNTFAREFTYTCGQIIEEFGLDVCPVAVQRAWQNDQFDTEFVIYHLIEPNYPVLDKKTGRAMDSMISDEFTFREVYWVKGQKGSAPLSSRGFRSLPFGVFMWSQVSNDPYGRSPCMDCLGDNKQIQLETRRKAEFIEKGVRPPMGASVALKNEPASIQPAHITYMPTGTQGKEGFWPLFEPNPAWLTGLTADIELVSKRLEKALFVDVFMAITQMAGVQPRNELELTQRNLERLQSLGPIITGVEGTLATIIQRVLDIMMRRGLIDPLPQSLRGVPLKINFVSLMRQAQRAAEAVAMKDVMATAGGLQQAAQAAGLPSPLRILNLDQSMREYADISGYPISCLFTQDQVEANDKAHAQAMAQAQAPQNIMAAVQAAKGLSETSTGPGTALSAVTGGAPGG